LAFLKQLGRSDKLIRKHLEAPFKKNATYLSPKSQNELINIIGKQQILNKIIEEVNESVYFAVLADEVTSHNLEQMALCIGFVDAHQNIREEFLDFVYLERTSGREIVKAISDTHRILETEFPFQTFEDKVMMGQLLCQVIMLECRPFYMRKLHLPFRLTAVHIALMLSLCIHVQ